MIGIINLLKPAGPTSHDMVNWLRRQLGIRQVGHLGTLDPGAVGVLPVCVGPATRLAEYMSDWVKTYRVEMLLGLETDSQDLFGKPINNHKDFNQITEEKIRTVLSQFQGQQEQIPPMVSAVKQQGRRLYELAREGTVVSRKPRAITIHGIHIHLINTMKSYPRVLFDVTVSKGTYIRTLCADVGECLGCGGCMAFLVRTRCGPLAIEEAWTPEEIKTACQEGDSSFLMPPKIGLGDWPVWTITLEARSLLNNGAFLRPNHFLGSGALEVEPGTMGCLQLPGGELLAVGRVQVDSSGHHYCHPEKVLVSRNV
jgi:tRNA pseudouridine55 synthase